MALEDSIFRQIEQLDYVVGESTEGDTLVFVAEPLVDIDYAKRGPKRLRHMVRIDGTDEESRYLAACQLAIQCGIDLEG